LLGFLPQVVNSSRSSGPPLSLIENTRMPASYANLYWMSAGGIGRVSILKGPLF
jgi:hypothetical protein